MMNHSTSDSELEVESHFEYDPAYLNSLRELYGMIAILAVSLIWTIGYCSIYAYQTTEPTSIILGVPGWVIGGIAVPWAICGLVTMLYALYYIKDDDADILALETPAAPSHSDEGASE